MPAGPAAQRGRGLRERVVRRRGGTWARTCDAVERRLLRVVVQVRHQRGEVHRGRAVRRPGALPAMVRVIESASWHRGVRSVVGSFANVHRYTHNTQLLARSSELCGQSGATTGLGALPRRLYWADGDGRAMPQMAFKIPKAIQNNAPFLFIPFTLACVKVTAEPPSRTSRRGLGRRRPRRLSAATRSRLGT